jgi:hypothetical protein
MPTLFPDTRLKKFVAACLLLWLAALATWSRMRYAQENERFSPEPAMALIAQAKAALADVKAQSGSYPPSGGQWLEASPGEFRTALAKGQGIGEFLAHARPFSGDPQECLLYRCDGKDYKLIWHRGGSCNAVHAVHPELVDPVRTAYSRTMVDGGWEASTANEAVVAKARNPQIKFDPAVPNPLFGTCWAFGTWTQGAVFW